MIDAAQEFGISKICTKKLSAVKNKGVCLHNIYVCVLCMFIILLYKHNIFFLNIYMHVCVFIHT